MRISFSQKIQVWLDSLLAKGIKTVLALDPGRVGASTCLGCKKNGSFYASGAASSAGVSSAGAASSAGALAAASAAAAS